MMEARDDKESKDSQDKTSHPADLDELLRIVSAYSGHIMAQTIMGEFFNKLEILENLISRLKGINPGEGLQEMGLHKNEDGSYDFDETAYSLLFLKLQAVAAQTLHSKLRELLVGKNLDNLCKTKTVHIEDKTLDDVDFVGTLLALQTDPVEQAFNVPWNEAQKKKAFRPGPDGVIDVAKIIQNNPANKPANIMLRTKSGASILMQLVGKKPVHVIIRESDLHLFKRIIKGE